MIDKIAGDGVDWVQPDLFAFWFKDRVILHRVTTGYLAGLTNDRFAVSVSRCGKLCHTQVPSGNRAVTLCALCFA